MKSIRLRTKIEIVSVSLFLLSISIFSVASVTRTITDSQDNIITFIRNSNGKYWETTVGNIQLAIDDLAGDGIVWIPAGTYSITKPLYVNHSYVTLQGVGGLDWNKIRGATIFDMDASTNILEIGNGTKIYGCQVRDIKFKSDSRTLLGDAIRFINCNVPLVDRCGFHGINGSAVNFSGATYCGRLTNCDTQACGGHITANPLGTIRISSTDGEKPTGTYITGNVFHASYSYEIEDVVDGHAAGGTRILDNYFEGANTITEEKAAIYGYFAMADISGNYFFWNSASEATAINLTNDASDGATITNNRIKGWKNGVHLQTNEDSTIVCNNVFLNLNGGQGVIDDGTDNIVKNNYGYIYSSYEVIPTSASNPYSSNLLDDGSMYFVTGNQSLAVYYGGTWYYYEHS